MCLYVPVQEDEEGNFYTEVGSNVDHECTSPRECPQPPCPGRKHRKIMRRSMPPCFSCCTSDQAPQERRMRSPTVIDIAIGVIEYFNIYYIFLVAALDISIATVDILIALFRPTLACSKLQGKCPRAPNLLQRLPERHLQVSERRRRGGGAGGATATQITRSHRG
jgi:hypothetical protein